MNPGEYPQEVYEEERASGAATGTSAGYALPRVVYGVYENREEAEGALAEISEKQQRDAPLRLHGDKSFLIPTGRVCTTWSL